MRDWLDENVTGFGILIAICIIVFFGFLSFIIYIIHLEDQNRVNNKVVYIRGYINSSDLLKVQKLIKK